MSDPAPAAAASHPARKPAGKIRTGRVLVAGVSVAALSLAACVALVFVQALRLAMKEQWPPDPERLTAYATRLTLWLPPLLNLFLTFFTARGVALKIRSHGWLNGALVGAVVAFLDLLAVIFTRHGNVVTWAGVFAILVMAGGLGGAWGDRTREYRLLTR